MTHERTHSVALPVDCNRLKSGDVEEIDVQLSAQAIDLVNEQELKIAEPIKVHLRAFVAEESLICSLEIEVLLELPCSLCREPFSFPLHILEYTHEEPLSQIKHGMFDAGPLVREAILLEIPFYPQCGGKECKNRASVEKYLKKEKKDNYHPFDA